MKNIKKFLSVLLTMVILLGAAPIMGLTELTAKAASECEVGDLVAFGSYPQTEVKDEATLNALNSQSLNWVSYGYYSGDGDYGSMKSSDYMKYADVTYNGNKYRAVKFTEYRPYWTGYASSGSNSEQDDNGYYTNTTYWFKYEPLKWRVLDPNKGLIMCETIIDSQAYSNTMYYNNSEYWNDSSYTNYANDYETSSIREWLNDDFYNTAFTSSQKSAIKSTTLDNSSSWSSEYDSASTKDKVFLLSWNEVLNTKYGFNSRYSSGDTARRAQGSDYAKCQGLDVHKSSNSAYGGNSYWWLRSPGDYSSYACLVNYDGYVYYCDGVYYSSIGVRPALKISNLESSAVGKQVHTAPDFESANKNYADTYFNGCGLALDGAGDTADLCIPELLAQYSMVPQGVAYYEAKNWMLISAYHQSKVTKTYMPSKIFALDMTTGSLVAEWELKKTNGDVYDGHAGGIAVTQNNLYITNGSGISYIPLSSLDVNAGSLKFTATKSLKNELNETSAAYVTVTDGILWTGNFYAKGEGYKAYSKITQV